jgi:3-hydroxybutyryl-CoA dehydratase
MQQNLNFKAPVAIGDTITATVEVIEVILEKKRVRFKTVCTNQNNVVVLDGEALISPPRRH